MTTKYQALALFGSIVLATTSSTVVAQDTSADPATTVSMPVENDDGDEGKWGLLGLLGLAGLLGLKRRDDVRHGNNTTSNRM